MVKKKAHRFSAFAIDQRNEQNNTAVKDDGGAVCLTENPAAPRHWMVEASTQKQGLVKGESIQKNCIMQVSCKDVSLEEKAARSYHSHVTGWHSTAQLHEGKEVRTGVFL